jgi:hypothetical protein
MEIVPLEDNLLVEARVKPRDIAFLRPGQETLVKITAYDFSIYGGFPGEAGKHQRRLDYRRKKGRELLPRACADQQRDARSATASPWRSFPA